MTPRRASIAGLGVATFALLYVPVLLFCVYNVPGVFEPTGTISGALEKSFVVVTDLDMLSPGRFRVVKEHVMREG